MKTKSVQKHGAVPCKSVNESVTENHFSSGYDRYAQALDDRDKRIAEKDRIESQLVQMNQYIAALAQENEKNLLVNFITSSECPKNYLFIKAIVDQAVWAILQDSSDCLELFDSSGLTDVEMIDTARNFFIANRKEFVKQLNVSDDFVAFNDSALQNKITH